MSKRSLSTPEAEAPEMHHLLHRFAAGRPPRIVGAAIVALGAVAGIIVGNALAHAAPRPPVPPAPAGAVVMSAVTAGPGPGFEGPAQYQPGAYSNPGPGYQGLAQYGPGSPGTVYGPGYEGLAQYGPQGTYEGRPTSDYAATYAAEHTQGSAYERSLCQVEQAVKPWIDWGCGS